MESLASELLPFRIKRSQRPCVNDDAFENWIIKVQMSDASELDDLMDASAYKAFIKE